MHACLRHDPWKRLPTAKPCKGDTRVPDAIIGTNQLKETTLTKNPRSSKVAGVEHKASNLVAEKRHVKTSRQKNEIELIWTQIEYPKLAQLKEYTNENHSQEDQQEGQTLDRKMMSGITGRRWNL